MMKNITLLLLTVFMLSELFSCKVKTTNQEEQLPVVSVKSTLVKKGDIENFISFNGKTIYLKKNQVVSPIAGYIVKMNIKFGDKIKKNDVLFEVQTREGNALGNTDNSSGNIGIVKVQASSGGFINELNINETGGYVVEGAPLCNIADNKDLIVQVNVPFKYISLLKTGTKCKILLSDNSVLEGFIYRILPVIDEVNQTQTVLIKPQMNRQLPENLNLTVQFVNEKHSGSYLIPKQAVMTNETQTEYWVMKITDNNMSVKIPVLKGIENDTIVEIISTGLNLNDKIISEGAYGLPDSTVVKIEK